MYFVIRGFKYRIYPNAEQVEYFANAFGAARWIYNWGLAEKVKNYETKKENLTCIDLTNRLKDLKKKNEWLKETGNDSLQMSLRKLDRAFTSFFRKQNRFPKFKSKRTAKQVFRTSQNTFIRDGKLKIPKCNLIKIKLDRKFEGKYCGCAITKTPTGKYFASFIVDDEKELPKKKKPNEKKTIGIDLGLKDFAVFSTGVKIANPKEYRKLEKRLAVIQRRFSRKKKGSANRLKAKLKVALIHEKIAARRSDFLHKLSSRLVAENQSIAIEDLNVAGMQKNHCLAKSISDASWAEFRGQLEYKCDWNGKNLLVIGRFEPSSKICSCGEINHELKLSDREWTCKKCKLVHDRDILASQNIVRFAFAPTSSRVEPVELPAVAGAVKQEAI